MLQVQPRSSLSDQTFRSKSFSDAIQHKKGGLADSQC